MNFLDETIKFLNDHGKTENDVIWVGNDKVYSHWENFKESADFIYDDGYGSQEIVNDLVVVGKDFWLERWEYDGSEGWKFKVTPKMPNKRVVFKHFKSKLWYGIDGDNYE